MTDRQVLLMVSGNTFSIDPWVDHTARLWRELATGFDELHVFARSEDQRFHEIQERNISLHLIPRGPARMATFIFTSWWLLVLVRRIRPTCIQSQSPVHGGLASVVCGRLFGIPVLVEIHGEHYLRWNGLGVLSYRRLYRPLTMLAFWGATRIRSLSPEMTVALGDVYGGCAVGKIVEITNRVDLDVFSPPKTDYHVGPVLRIISVGALNTNKNHLGLIHDLAALKRPCRLTLVGAGPLEGALRQSAAELGLPLEIRSSVNHSELSQLLRSHDIYVQFSRSEAVSRAVLEAMAIGLPVVVTPVGFLGGILVTGITGVRIGDPGIPSLSDAMDILYDEQARRSLGEGARHEVEARHEWKTVFAQHRSVLLGMSAR